MEDGRPLDGEAVATLFATRREDLTAVLGAHAFEEAMDALASAVMRLKGPLHQMTPRGAKDKSTLLYPARPPEVKNESQFGNRSRVVHTCGEACGQPRSHARREACCDGASCRVFSPGTNFG